MSIDPNRDDKAWASSVLESYHAQKARGINEPLLFEGFRKTMPSGICFEELGKLGLVTAEYPDGVFLEPIAEYPRRGHQALVNVDVVSV